MNKLLSHLSQMAMLEMSSQPKPSHHDRPEMQVRYLSTRHESEMHIAHKIHSGRESEVNLNNK
jgi:hypothetical protein